MPPLSRMRSAAIVIVMAAGTSLHAHDFWIEPRSFSVTPGTLVGLHLMVGQEMLGDALAREASGIERFVVQRGDDEQPIPGRDGGDPAGVLRVPGPGLLLVAYQSRPHAVELPRAKFETYLGEEGLDAVKSMLAGRPARPAIARERFARCAKSLLTSGPPVATQRDRPVGLTLELVAGRNPYASAPNDDFPVTLLYKGAPQAGALVIALNRDDPTAKVTGRSDAGGRVTFRLARSGVWLIKAVHMIPAQPGTEADWESFWASLTFELPATRAPR